jgi:hypothetical protein
MSGQILAKIALGWITLRELAEQIAREEGGKTSASGLLYKFLIPIREELGPEARNIGDKLYYSPADIEKIRQEYMGKKSDPQQSKERTSFD